MAAARSPARGIERLGLIVSSWDPEPSSLGIPVDDISLGDPVDDISDGARDDTPDATPDEAAGVVAAGDLDEADAELDVADGLSDVSGNAQRLAALDELDSPPLAEHPDVFERVHGELRSHSPPSTTPEPGRAVPRRLSRLDAELVRRGLARSREHASELIAAGRVEVRGVTAAKPATGVDGDASVRVRADDNDPGYASRGGHKLAGALAAFPADRASPASAASTPARRPAGSPTCCCEPAQPGWSPSTSATGSWPGRCGPTSGSRCTTAPTSAR